MGIGRHLAFYSTLDFGQVDHGGRELLPAGALHPFQDGGMHGRVDA
jgi:hypothetical protein